MNYMNYELSLKLKPRIKFLCQMRYTNSLVADTFNGVGKVLSITIS